VTLPVATFIGDDEHGWSKEGAFNSKALLAKVVNLSAKANRHLQDHPDVRHVLENVVLDPVTRKVRFEDTSITENTRASYPLHYIENHVANGQGRHPKNIVFLTADAFGVLPPIAKLTRDQAMYYFLSGYTARSRAPSAESPNRRPRSRPASAQSSSCGTPPSTPRCSASSSTSTRRRCGCEHRLDGWRLRHRFAHEARLHARDGERHAPRRPEGAHGQGSRVRSRDPEEDQGRSAQVLVPRNTWKDKKAYDAQAAKLAQMFKTNFEKFGSFATDAVKKAGPK